MGTNSCAVLSYLFWMFIEIAIGPERLTLGCPRLFIGKPVALSRKQKAQQSTPGLLGVIVGTTVRRTVADQRANRSGTWESVTLPLLS